jgi:hypothetical protein
MRILLASAAVGCVLLAAPAFAGGGHGGAAMGGGGASMMTSHQTTTTSTTTTQRGPSHTGQPNQTCGSATAPTTPGNAASASGSAFNPDGKAGTVYAGQQPQNSGNTASVSQYDVACSHQPQ